MASLDARDQPRLLILGNNSRRSIFRSPSFSAHVPNVEVHILDAGHFALDTAADEIAALVQGFLAI